MIGVNLNLGGCLVIVAYLTLSNACGQMQLPNLVVDMFRLGESSI